MNLTSVAEDVADEGVVAEEALEEEVAEVFLHRSHDSPSFRNFVLSSHYAY